MLLVTERKLTQEEIKKYREREYRIHYAWYKEVPEIKYGEPVGFIMETYLPSTIRLMKYLVDRPRSIKVDKEITQKDGTKKIIKVNKPLPVSRITALVNNEKVYVDQENWKSTHYDDKTRKWYSVKNPVLEVYDEQQKIRKQNREDYKKRKRTEELGEIPEDLDRLLSSFAKLYEVDYEPEDTESKLRAYQQIKYYLDNDFEYSRDLLGQLPTEELMFECIAFGDETYLEDISYKETA